MEYFPQHFLGVVPLLQSVQVICLVWVLAEVIQLPPVPVDAPVRLLGVQLGILETHPLSVAELGRPHGVAWTEGIVDAKQEEC